MRGTSRISEMPGSAHSRHSSAAEALRDTDAARLLPSPSAAYNTNLTPLVTGPVIELSERRAKIRSNR